MKKLNNNNKFRGNNGNTIYSLNYKFDSVSSAGKLSGTALDLIKKYNELAKEAHNNGDYVQMEVFRQYAEHYRKIVTEINERKNQNRDNQSAQQTADNGENGENAENKQEENTNLVETEAAAPSAQAAPEAEAEAKPVEKPKRRRSFTVIDVAAKENNAENAETVTEQSVEPASEETTEAEQAEKPRRRVLTRRRTIKPTAENTEAEQNG